MECILFQRWNRLSRLQRSLVYAVVVIIATILIVLYSTRTGSAEGKKKDVKKSVQVSVIL